MFNHCEVLVISSAFVTLRELCVCVCVCAVDWSAVWKSFAIERESKRNRQRVENETHRAEWRPLEIWSSEWRLGCSYFYSQYSLKRNGDCGIYIYYISIGGKVMVTCVYGSAIFIVESSLRNTGWVIGFGPNESKK